MALKTEFGEVGPLIEELIGLLNGNISVEASLGNWKVDLSLDAKNINKLITSLPDDGEGGGYDSD